MRRRWTLHTLPSAWPAALLWALNVECGAGHPATITRPAAQTAKGLGLLPLPPGQCHTPTQGLGKGLGQVLPRPTSPSTLTHPSRAPVVGTGVTAVPVASAAEPRGPRLPSGGPALGRSLEGPDTKTAAVREGLRTEDTGSSGPCSEGPYCSGLPAPLPTTFSQTPF